MNKPQYDYDVIIIGAGPSGALAASLLVQQGIRVLMVEKQHFPRFSIGESLLPQSMVYLEQANLLEAVVTAADRLGFQYKDGAAFYASGQESTFEFSKKFSQGPEHTYQVKRADFDHLLATEAERMGAEIIYGSQVTDLQFSPTPALTLCDEAGQSRTVAAQFVLDASGFARVLPRLLDLDVPSDFPVRGAVFTHVIDNITDPSYDRNKILIETHPQNPDVWYWLIPFSDGTASVGCVAQPDFLMLLEKEQSLEASRDLLKACLQQTHRFSQLLSNAEFPTKTQRITGYSANVKKLYGDHFALLGNAGEFLDPIFSSGVTIAFKSAKLASDCLLKQLKQEPVCWETEFAEPLSSGVTTFKAFVNSWYDGQLQDILQFEQAPDNIREMICSILAGYVWDDTNPFNQAPQRRLNVIGELCAS